MARGQAPPQDQPAHVEFLLRCQGTLPEIITEANLETLNSGLRFLFARLREARQQFESERDGGRKGASTALAATWMFTVLFEGARAESLQVPILYLQDALDSLEKGRVLPILKQKRAPRGGRAPSSEVRAHLRGYAAGTVQRLMKTGLSRQDAFRAVAKRLSQLGVRPERGAGKFTADTVRHWYDEVAADVGRHGTEATMFDSMFTADEASRFSTLPPAQARSHALASLAGWVRVISPALNQKPVNPPS
jgi:hypothetical protein